MKPSPRVSLLLALLLALGTVLAPRPAAAGEDAATKAARRHFSKGDKLFALGRFDEALEHFEKAYEAKPIAGFLFNIAQCHRNLGHIDEAIFSYRKYLSEQPDADNRDKVEQQIEELEEERDKRDANILQEPPPVGRKRPGTAKNRSMLAGGSGAASPPWQEPAPGPSCSRAAAMLRRPISGTSSSIEPHA